MIECEHSIWIKCSGDHFVRLALGQYTLQSKLDDSQVMIEVMIDLLRTSPQLFDNI